MNTKLLVALLAGASLLAACERPPMENKQYGYRGTGMGQTDNPRTLAAQKAATAPVPDLPPPGPAEGPKAKDIYQNVKVLGDLSIGEFTRHMLAITQWVAPAEGCNYCHNPANLADDSKYTKVVSRRMIEMTQHLNADWGKHVGATGVTCYTCHRGNAVPSQIWFTAETPKNNRTGSGMGNDAGQNKATPSIALASLPYDPFSGYIGGGKTGADEIRVQGTQALPQDDHRTSTKQAEFTYSLMNHMSKSLGVNCTFCHNTRSFQSWDGPAQRVTAWHGLRLARDLNSDYLVPLTKTFPAHRLGPTGDVAKVNCGTCHQGANKPLGGLAMAKDYAGLQKVAALAPGAAAVAAAPAPAAVPAPAATPAAAPAPAAPAQVAMAAPTAAAPTPSAQALRSIVYFAVGSPAIDAKGSDELSKAIDALKANPGATATISGFHSASGTLAQNQELAKQRAFAVRDALTSAGVAASRVVLEKPQQTEANVSGEDASSRRVEVTVK